MNIYIDTTLFTPETACEEQQASNTIIIPDTPVEIDLTGEEEEEDYEFLDQLLDSVSKSELPDTLPPNDDEPMWWPEDVTPQMVEEYKNQTI